MFNIISVDSLRIGCVDLLFLRGLMVEIVGFLHRAIVLLSSYAQFINNKTLAPIHSLLSIFMPVSADFYTQSTRPINTTTFKYLCNINTHLGLRGL